MGFAIYHPPQARRGQTYPSPSALAANGAKSKQGGDGDARRRCTTFGTPAEGDARLGLDLPRHFRGNDRP